METNVFFPIVNNHQCFSQLFLLHLNTMSTTSMNIFVILSSRGSTLDVRLWRLKSIPALKGLSPILLLAACYNINNKNTERVLFSLHQCCRGCSIPTRDEMYEAALVVDGQWGSCLIHPQHASHASSSNYAISDYCILHKPSQHWNTQLLKQWRSTSFFKFEILIDVLVISFRFIWIPMLWVYGHYKYLNSLSAGIVLIS